MKRFILQENTASMSVAAETLRAHGMAVQRYDVRDAGGSFVER
jgi:hypothetical protein